jgi:hypothetical protein
MLRLDVKNPSRSMIMEKARAATERHSADVLGVNSIRLAG